MSEKELIKAIPKFNLMRPLDDDQKPNKNNDTSSGKRTISMNYNETEVKKVISEALEESKDIKNLSDIEKEEEEGEIADDENDEDNNVENGDINKNINQIYASLFYGKKSQRKTTDDFQFNSETAGFVERLLHPVQYGSERASIFSLSSMCLDSGTLVLAIRCGQFGLIIFVIFIILGGLAAYWSLNLMIESDQHLKIREYSKLTKISLGFKTGKFLDAMMTLYLFGLLISFLVVIYQEIGRIGWEIFMTNSYPTYDSFETAIWDTYECKAIAMFIVSALLLPLCYMKDISKLRIPCLIGVCCLIYTILVIIIECPFYGVQFSSLFTPSCFNLFDITKAFEDYGYGFFTGLATVFFMFSCHAGAFPIYKSLHNPTRRRVKKVFRLSVILDTTIYVCAAVSSYITCFWNYNDVDLVVNRPSIFEYDIPMLIGKIGIVLDLFFSFPANYTALRTSIFELFCGTSKIKSYQNYLVTTIIICVMTTIGILYDEILSYISLLGGFCSVIYCFLIPALLYVHNNGLPKTNPKNVATLTIVIILTVIGYASGIYTILFDIAKVIHTTQAPNCPKDSSTE